MEKDSVDSRKSIPCAADGGIAGALARALEERRKNMANSDGQLIEILFSNDLSKK